MTLATATVATPPGPLTIVATGDGAVVASGWTPDAAALIAAIGPARVAAAAGAPVDPDALERRADLGPVTDAVAAYLDGDVAAIDGVPVAQAGSPFLARAWRELRAIPAGAPRTYAELARSCESPRAIRAAGSACARNAAALFVPCHRVLRTGGGLGGFAYGLPVKRWLLDHEAAHAARAPKAVVAASGAA